MDLPRALSQIPLYMAKGCLLVAFCAGTACSSEGEGPGVRVNAPSPDLDEQQATLFVVEPQTDSNGRVAVVQNSSEIAAPELTQGEVSEYAQGLSTRLRSVQSQAAEQLDEILNLYRRLHIELDDLGRSGLIVDLFHDSRTPVRLLGFELVDRDLSSSTLLAPSVGESARIMLADSDAVIRSKSASLISRLVLPDAMLILTDSLKIETEPIAAEPMLIGIARWPNPEARDIVLEWFGREDSPINAVCNAAWSLEYAGFWDPQVHHALLIAHLRNIDPTLLNEAAMKLTARCGDASDLQTLVSLLLTDNPNQQQWAANALVETPRAIELLVQAAENNSKLFLAAADSLINHRATPEGLRRLASLPSPSKEIRLAALTRMGAALENERLAEAVRLAGLDPTQSALLLSRLLNGDQVITPRIAKGIVFLAEIEFANARPNRAFEASVSLDDITLDPIDRAKITSIKASSLILLGRHKDAAAISQDITLWFQSIHSSADEELRKRVASFMLAEFQESLTDRQLEELRKAAKLAEPSTD